MYLLQKKYTQIIQVSKEIGLDETLASKFLNFLLNESIKVQSENKQTHLSIFLKAKSLEQKGKKIISNKPLRVTTRNC